MILLLGFFNSEFRLWLENKVKKTNLKEKKKKNFLKQKNNNISDLQ